MSSRQASELQKDNQAEASATDFITLAHKSWPQWRAVNDQLEKNGLPPIRSYEEFRTMSKEAIEASVKSASVLADGVQEMGRQGLALMQDIAESGLQAARAAADAQSLQDWVRLQSDWTQRCIAATARIAKLSGTSLTVSSQAAEPLRAHINGAFGKFARRD